MVPKLTYRKNRKKEIYMQNTNMNLKDDTAQMYANIAAEIYGDDDIKSLMENAESVSIKVGNNKPLSFKVDEIAKIAKSK